MTRFGQTHFVMRSHVTTVIAKLQEIGWMLHESTELKMHNGWSTQVDMVWGRSDEEMEIRQMQLNFYFTDEKEA